jgi:hypothetical protein
MPPKTVGFDALRAFVFPNNLREARRRAGYAKLLQLSQKIPEIPYIRLSKIERGEVFARPDELIAIAGLLEIEPVDLLIDVEAPDFDLARWAAPFVEGERIDPAEERFAVLLGAALHMRRASDRSLTIALLNEGYGLPPVIVSRIENAAKTLDRWNDHVVAALLRLFGERSVAGLRRAVEALHRSGRLDPYLESVSNPELRREKSRIRIAELRRQLLEGGPSAAVFAPTAGDPPTVAVRLFPVFGCPLPDGLVAPVATGEQVAGPLRAGARCYGLRIGRPTLGGGMPGNAILIVDPDRFPSSGGLAVINEGPNRRLLNVIIDRRGAMIGYSENPDREVALDALDPADIAVVIGACFE